VEKSISAGEANRNFSRVLREVGEGQSYVVTSHGTPVARIVPAKRSPADLAAAKQELIEYFKSRPIQVIGGKKWTRDELYDR
jgi:prevent-host-death family protein